MNDALKAPEPDRPARDPNTTALYSLFLPGAGHAYLGLWGQAVGRAVLSLWLAAVVVLTAAGGSAGTVLFAVMFFGLWVVTAHDAYREAGGRSDRVLLKQRYFLYVVLGILFLMMAMLVMQGFSAGGAGGAG